LPMDSVVGGSSNSPAAQQAWMCMDGITANYPNSKYLNFDKVNTAFYVTPAIGNTVVGGIRFFTAGDSPERDPTSFVLAGSTSTGTNGPWTQIAADSTGLVLDQNL